MMFHTTIQNNQGDAITLADLSNGLGYFGPFGADPSEIRDNDGWGSNCAGPAAITSAQNGFEIGRILFSGNAAGDTNCP